MAAFSTAWWAGPFMRWLTPAWVAVSLGVIGWQLALHWDEVIASPVSVSAILLAFAATLAAKLFAALQVRLSLGQPGADIPQSACFYSYSMADLAKYLPGGIWGFVGRIALYRRLRLRPATIGRALVLEQIWLVGGALTVGFALFAFGRLDFRWQLLSMIGAATWMVFLTLSGCLADGQRMSLGRAVGLAAIQLGLWLAAGLGFAALLPSGHLASAGIFSIAFAAGLLVPFAPSGIGVREAALATLALPSLPMETILQAMVFSRVVWIAADVVFAGIVAPTCRAGWRRAAAAPS
jgi:hypothetical protein